MVIVSMGVHDFISTYYYHLLPVVLSDYIIMRIIYILLIVKYLAMQLGAQIWDEITYPFPNFSGCTVEV